VRDSYGAPPFSSGIGVVEQPRINAEMSAGIISFFKMFSVENY
jgi:hypothetical protein